MNSNEISISLQVEEENNKETIPTSNNNKEETREFGDTLNETEMKLFKLVKEGIPQAVQSFIQDNTDVSLNKKDNNLHTIIQIAVIQENTEMVKVLLANGCNDSRARELAEALDLHDILQLLTTQSSAQENDELDGQEINRDIERDQEIRKILKMAVDDNNYDEVKRILDELQSKYPDNRVLSLNCLCPGCKKASSRLLIKPTKKNLQELRKNHLEVCYILSSPAYILLTANNPIWQIIQWVNRFQKMIDHHEESKHDLMQLIERCSKLAVEMLPTDFEDKDLKPLFSSSHKPNENDFGSQDFSLEYKCLHDAIGAQQKQFIAHPASQHVISKLWLKEYYTNWKKWSKIRRLWHIFWHILLAPFRDFLFVGNLCMDLDFVSVPLNRFIYSATMYTLFLSCVTFNQYRERPKYGATFSIDWFDIFILVWMVDYACKLLHDIFIRLPFSYVTMWWSLYEAVVLVFFLAGMSTFIVGCGSTTGQRDDWHLVLVSQGLYAIGITLACMRSLQWLHLSANIGPLVVSFGRMIVDLQKFFVIFAIILFSFSIGIYTVYTHFEADDPIDDDTFFASYKKTLKILFWALLGKGEANYATVPDQYHYFIGNVTYTAGFQDSFTVIVGYTLWTLFHITVVIILLNMLIALVTQNYQAIQDNSDTEWKFACVHFQLHYIEDKLLLLPPLSIIFIGIMLIGVIIGIIIGVPFALCSACCKKECGCCADEVDKSSAVPTKLVDKSGAVPTKLKGYKGLVNHLAVSYIQKEEIVKLRKQKRMD